MSASNPDDPVDLGRQAPAGPAYIKGGEKKKERATSPRPDPGRGGQKTARPDPGERETENRPVRPRGAGDREPPRQTPGGEPENRQRAALPSPATPPRLRPPSDMTIYPEDPLALPSDATSPEVGLPPRCAPFGSGWTTSIQISMPRDRRGFVLGSGTIAQHRPEGARSGAGSPAIPACARDCCRAAPAASAVGSGGIGRSPETPGTSPPARATG